MRGGDDNGRGAKEQQAHDSEGRPHEGLGERVSDMRGRREEMATVVMVD